MADSTVEQNDSMNVSVSAERSHDIQLLDNSIHFAKCNLDRLRKQKNDWSVAAMILFTIMMICMYLSMHVWENDWTFFLIGIISSCLGAYAIVESYNRNQDITNLQVNAMMANAQLQGLRCNN